MKALITLQELALKLNGKFWSNNGKERVYIDRGYNTKKMSTKTYVEQSDSGVFCVKCFIDCPSQDYNWIKSQQNQIIESVEEEISEIIELSKVQLIESRLSEDKTEVEVRISYNGIVENEFLTEAQFDERFNKYPQNVFDNLPEVKTIVKESIGHSTRLKANSSMPEPKNKVELCLGQRVSHPRFGLGEIVEEIENDGMKKLRIIFETEGEKLLLERFANLTLL